MKNLMDITEDVVKVLVILGKAPENDETQDALDIIQTAASDLCEHMGLDISYMIEKYRRRRA